MSTRTITENLVTCDEGDRGATPHRRNRYCTNPRECVIAALPAPDAEGGWYVLGNRVVDGIASTIATAASPEFAAQIVRDHSGVPKLVDALVSVRNAAQVFADSKYLDTARAGLLQIVKGIDAALASAQEKR